MRENAMVRWGVRPRVLVALLFVPACTAPAWKNFSSGVDDDPSTGETTGTSSGTTGTSGGIETSGGTDTSSGGSGSAGMTMSTSSTGSTAGSTSTTTSGAETTGTSSAEPFCGDGVVEGEEECDDGNIDWQDGCNQVCARDRVAFATDELFQPFQLGGAEIADDICKQAAGLAELPNEGSYTAWLSDSTSDAIDRVYKGRGRYVLPNGTVIASDFLKLMLGPLQHPIDVTEYGEPAIGGAWTGTQPDGTLAPGLSHCQDWTINGPADFTVAGSLMGTDGRWTQMPNPAPCGDEARIYCFEGE